MVFRQLSWFRNFGLYAALAVLPAACAQSEGAKLVKVPSVAPVSRADVDELYSRVETLEAELASVRTAQLLVRSGAALSLARSGTMLETKLADARVTKVKQALQQTPVERSEPIVEEAAELPPKTPILTRAAAKQSPAVPVSMPKFDAAGEFAVHLASYQERSGASSGWQRLLDAHPDILNGLEPVVSEFNDEDMVFYRLKAGRFADRASADAICEVMSDIDAYCATTEFEGVPLFDFIEDNTAS
ncbi:MAG: SPOR domain-containing protein [Pseudomonadota bacterium]